MFLKQAIPRLTALLLAGSLVPFGASAPGPAEGVAREILLHAAPSFAFEPNLGQAGAGVRYLLAGGGRTVLLRQASAMIAVAGTSDGEPIVMRWLGANPAARITPLEPSTAQKHYYLGNDPEKWVSGVPSYGRIRYHDVYPGIDLDFYERAGLLEYDFIVRPGADPSPIRLRFEGADAHINEAGELTLKSGDALVRHARPYVYQVRSGEREAVGGSFRTTEDGMFRFELEKYDEKLALVIDPLVVFSTFLGGSGVETAHSGIYTAEGDLWVVGQTDSTDFPGGAATGTDGFVARYAETGVGETGYELTEMFVVGGAGTDTVKDITTDSSGTLFIGGDTNSNDFPGLAEPPAMTDMWVATLNTPPNVAAPVSGHVAQTDRPRTVTITELFGDVGDDSFGGFADEAFFDVSALRGESRLDVDGDGQDDTSFFGNVGQPGGGDNVIFAFDNETLRQRAQYRLRSAGGGEYLSGMAYDVLGRRWVYAGSSAVGLAGATKPGGNGIFKQFVGSIDFTDITIPDTFTAPFQIDQIRFIEDGSSTSTHVFSQALAIVAREASSENPVIELLTAGTTQQGTNFRGYVHSFPLLSGGFRLEAIRRLLDEVGWTSKDLGVDGVGNPYVVGHSATRSGLRTGLRRFDLRTGDILGSLLSRGAGSGSAESTAVHPNGRRVAVVGSASANQDFAGDPGGTLNPFDGGLLDVYVAQADLLQLNPQAILNAGKFSYAPLAPYGLYTIFIDWPAIPGLILPGPIDRIFPKEVAGLEVLVNDAPTSITAVSAGQVNFATNADVTSRDPAEVVLRWTNPETGDEFFSNPITVPTAPSWFNPFEINGLAAILHAGGVLTPDNPIGERDFPVLFGTGMGNFGNPAIGAGELTPGDQIFSADGIPTVTAIVPDGQEFPVDVLFGGPSPGSISSLQQLNLEFNDAFWEFCRQQMEILFTIRLVDTQAATGSYTDPLGATIEPIVDTEALARCPQ